MTRNHRNQLGIYNFIWRLYKSLFTPDNQGVIEWTNNGNSFVVLNLETFSKVTLHKEFGLDKFNSFHRQLNIYGFRKNRSNRNGLEFSNPYFKMGQMNLLINIKNSSTSCLNYNKK